MSEHATPRLIFLSDPSMGVGVLNIQEEGKELQRFELTREQLFALNAKSADILMKGQGK